MKTISYHPETEILELHLLNRLIARENEVVEEHLLVCHKCRLASQGLWNDIKLIRAALG